MTQGEKRLAVHVEDHPVDYATFEGVIPEGNYGAGTVEIWDHGTWQPVEADADRALAKGDLKFDLAGERLHGRFVLVRMKPKPKERAENWLLIKERDAADAAPAKRAPARKVAPPAKGKASRPRRPGRRRRTRWRRRCRPRRRPCSPAMRMPRPRAMNG
jgi:bifunctional non-homologous end joining protein LigD